MYKIIEQWKKDHIEYTVLNSNNEEMVKFTNEEQAKKFKRIANNMLDNSKDLGYNRFTRLKKTN